ncbi:MAG: hypothetical protein ACR2G6_01155 [Gemmatimonadaceae bacterium]
MANTYSVADLLDFLEHASDRGLMPAATATALAVATRNVLGVLDDAESQDVRGLDLDAVARRFANKRARDFNPSSLKEYGRRVHKAVNLFLQWREDPANFTVKTRATGNARRKESASRPETDQQESIRSPATPGAASPDDRGYQSAFPIRPGTVVTVSNIPSDLTPAEAERLAAFVRMLVIE